ncbi:MAG: GDSL-type esterase/lipase family protein [Anaerolineae bacterium]
MKLIFFGDSLTHGSYGVNFVAKVAADLPRHQFINAGVNGDTSFNLFHRVDTDVIEHKPDGCFIMIGINDAVSYAEPGLRPYYRVAKGVKGGQISPIFFRENLRAIFSKLAYASIKTWVALPPIEYRPEAVAALHEMNAQTRELCAEMSIPLLDIMSQLAPAVIPARPPIGLSYFRRNFMVGVRGKAVYEKLRTEGSFTYSFDGIHLTEEGAQRIATTVVKFLKTNGLV